MKQPLVMVTRGIAGLRDFVVTASVGLALGAIVIGYGVALPGLEQSVDAGLIDGNLHVALREPLVRGLTNALLLTSAVIAITRGPWTTGQRVTRPPGGPSSKKPSATHESSASANAAPRSPTLAGTLALLLVAVAAALRLWIVPKLLYAWSRVDVVAGRPALELEQAESWSQAHEIGLAAALALLLALLAVTTRHPRAAGRVR